MCKPLFFARCPLCSFYTWLGWQGKRPQGVSSHCSASAPNSSAAVCVSSKAMVVAFDFAWVTISLVGCQQRLILGPTTQTLKSWAEEVISLVGSYSMVCVWTGHALCQPGTLAWPEAFSGFRMVWNGLRPDYTSGVTDVSVKINYPFQFPL